MDDQHTVWQPIEPKTPNAYPSAYSNPYDSIPIPPPPPPTPKRPSWWVLAVALVIALLLFAATGLVYEAHFLLANQAKPTPIVRFVSVTPTAPAPTQRPTPTPIPPTPTPLVIVETATPTPMIVPYTASDIFQDFQAAGIAMSNVHADNSWCHACDYIPSGGAIAWQDYSGNSPVNAEIATFATTHAMLDDAHTIGSQGFHEYYQGRCLLFYGASDLADISSFKSVMGQYCY